jgi:hypothetical protein
MELLRGQLERSELELVGELTLRAAKWCAHHRSRLGHRCSLGPAVE